MGVARKVGAPVVALVAGALVGALAGSAVVSSLALPIDDVADTVVRLFALAGLLAAAGIYVAATRS
jgi:hypothetical protein